MEGEFHGVAVDRERKERKETGEQMEEKERRYGEG
jgi:hypothetical protein